MADFDLVFGNNAAKTRLASAIREDRLPHAILISGPTGSGKHTLATEVARGAMCLSGNTCIPCGTCSACQRVLAKGHPDVKYLGKDRAKASIGVEDVRLLRDDMFLSATESDYKFYIIDDSELLTTGAQNALLKVLEEPPKRVHIIMLTASEDKLLSTIRSRVQTIHTEIFTKDKVLEYLKRGRAVPSGTDDRAINLAAQFSGGIIGRAIESIRPDIAKDNATLNEMIKGFLLILPARTQFSEIYSAIMAFPTKREDLRRIFEGCIDAVRDMIACKCSENCQLLFFTSKDDVVAYIGSIPTKKLVDISEILLSSLADLDKNVIIQTLLGNLALRIKEL